VLKNLKSLELSKALLKPILQTQKEVFSEVLDLEKTKGWGGH
jgi:hypothetical protein